MAMSHRGIQRIGYAWVAVTDPRLLKSRPFYQDELGLLQTGFEANRAYFRCWHEPYLFSTVIEHSEQPRLVEIGFQVRDAADLDSAEEALASAGVPVQRAGPTEVLKGLGESLAFEVPAGPRLRLFAHIDQPGYITGYQSPDWVAPKPMRGTVAPLFFNHVAVTTPDVERCAAFLQDVLGFFTSEKIVGEQGQLVSVLLFRMSKNVGGQELALMPGARIGLHHLAYTKEDSSDILADATHLRSDGVPLEMLGPVRQPYGNTFSVYFRDPNGIRLELCSGGRMTERHTDFQPVVWSQANMKRALSYYDEEVDAAFLEPSL